MNVIEKLREVDFTKSDGATLNMDGSLYTGGGLVVPMASINTTTEAISHSMLGKFVAKYSVVTAGKSLYRIGLYKFPESSKISIDLNILAGIDCEEADRDKIRSAAIEFGRLSGQKALFDLDTFEEIETGADGSNPVNYDIDKFNDIYDAILKGEVPEIAKR